MPKSRAIRPKKIFKGLFVAFVLAANQYYNGNPGTFVLRNFFGVLSVTETWDGKYHVLWHGSTGHGTQQVRDDDGKLLTGRP